MLRLYFSTELKKTVIRMPVEIYFQVFIEFHRFDRSDGNIDVLVVLSVRVKKSKSYFKTKHLSIHILHKTTI